MSTEGPVSEAPPLLFSLDCPVCFRVFRVYYKAPKYEVPARESCQKALRNHQEKAHNLKEITALMESSR